MKRRGIALLAVLWVVVALGALTAGAVARARGATTATGERLTRLRARWAAEGCLAVALSRLDSVLQTRRTLAALRPDTLRFANGLLCTASYLDPSTRVQRDSGQETARLEEVLRAGGDQALAGRDSFLTRYGDGHVNLNDAPAPVLATLPGVGPEALRAIAETRAWHRTMRSLDDLLGRLSPGARASLLEHYATLMARTAYEPVSLVVTARAWADGRAGVSVVDVFVMNGGGRAAVVQRRMW